MVARASKATAQKSAATVVVQFGKHRGRTRTRLDATHWVDVGIKVLMRESIEQVRIERLATLLGVTKGSFYWHFKSRTQLHEAILERWLQKATLGVRERLNRESLNPSERLLSLLELPFWSPRAAGAADLELAIRGWGRRSALAREAIRKVDSIRLSYITELFRGMNFDADESLHRAHLAYGLIRYLSQLRDVPVDEERRIIHSGYACLLATRGDSVGVSASRSARKRQQRDTAPVKR